MRRTSSILLMAIALAATSASSGFAQQSLDKLEGILDREAAAEPQPAEPMPPKATTAKPAVIAEVRPGYLGLYAIEIDESLVVETVRLESPAAAAGIRPGDVLLRIGGAQVASLDEMSKILAPLKVGVRLPFVVRRSGRELSLVATLGERPKAASRVVEKSPEPKPTPAVDPSLDSLDALSELEHLLDDAPPAVDDVPSGESLVLKRLETLAAELKLLNARIGVLERTLERVETLNPEP